MSTAGAPIALPPSGASTVGRGIAYMLGAVFIFSAANVLVKWASATYPVGEIAFFRTFVALFPTLVLVAGHGGIARLRTRHPLSHLLRGGVGMASMLLIYYAFMALPIAEATAIGFAGPLFMTALSVPMLGEKVGVYRWSAIVVGFMGVLLITRPGRDILNLGALAAVTSAASYAVAMLLVRQMCKTEHPVTITFYFTAFGSLVMGCLLPFGWVTPDGPGLAALSAVGIAGGIGQYLQTEAFRLAPAAVAAPFNYVSIVFAGVFGYLIWDEVPTVPVVAGSAIVIVSGLFIIYRETVRRGQGASAPNHKR